MKRNLLFSEWREELSKISETLPGIKLGQNDMRVKFGHCIGSVSLQWGDSKHGDFLKPHTRVDKAVALVGTLSYVEAGIQDHRKVLDVLHYCTAWVENMRVWMQDCPCDFCSTRGKSGNSPCKYCDGKGFRQEKNEHGRKIKNGQTKENQALE